MWARMVRLLGRIQVIKPQISLWANIKRPVTMGVKAKNIDGDRLLALTKFLRRTGAGQGLDRVVIFAMGLKTKTYTLLWTG